MGRSSETDREQPRRAAKDANREQPPLPESIGNHRVIANLGKGGMGDVFLAVKQGIGGFSKLLVIKQLRPVLALDDEFLEMFLEEARIVSRLSHPNIVHTYEAGQDEAGSYFIAMEYLEGQPLHRIQQRALQRGQPFPLNAAVWILHEVLAAVHHAHELTDFDGSPLGLVHRDLSPQNIVVTYAGEVKVLDFGIAKAASSNVETRAGVYKGKLTCMAPEQLQGAGTTRRVDIFAVGAMLWRAVAEQSMWEGLTPPEIATRLVAGRVPRIRDVVPGAPEELLAIVDKATAADPGARYASALEMRRALDGFLDGVSEESMRESIAKHMSQLYGEERDAMRRGIDASLKQLGAASERGQTVPLPIIQAPYGTSTTSVGYVNQGTPIVQQPARQRSRWVLAAVSLLGFGAGAVALATVRHGDAVTAPRASNPPPAATGQSAPQAAPSTARFDVSVSPATARISIDGVSAPNPYSARVPIDGVQKHLRVQADGYESQDHYITIDGDQRLTLSLVRKDAPSQAHGSRSARDPARGRQSSAVAPHRRTAPARDPGETVSPGTPLKPGETSLMPAEPLKANEAPLKASEPPPGVVPKVQVIDEPEVQVIE